MREILAAYLLLVSIWLYSSPVEVGQWYAKVVTAYLRAMAGG